MLEGWAGSDHWCISRSAVIRCGFGRRGVRADEGAGGAGEGRGNYQTGIWEETEKQIIKFISENRF